MNKVIATMAIIVFFQQANAQAENNSLTRRFYDNHLKIGVEPKNAQLFAEIFPQFFAFNGFGGGFGLEFNRLQIGAGFLKTKLTPTFRDAIFSNAENATVPVNIAAEIFVNVFLRKDRKGFYAGTILSHDLFTVIDNQSQLKDNFTKQYVVARAGFRWFPFQEHFYIDGGYGVSFNINKAESRSLGNTNYSPKAVLMLPFIAVGGRISLSSKK